MRYVPRETYDVKADQVVRCVRVLKATRTLFQELYGHLTIASDIAVDDATRFTELRDAQAKILQCIAVIDEVTQ